MTITQLDYIIALEIYRNFSIAAEKCFVTQPTLSMQIQKLEEELGVMIFDRSKHPIVPTAAGIEIIEQAQIILLEVQRLKEIVREQKQEISGELRIGIIPTLAPFLLPLFLGKFAAAYPKVSLKIEEQPTENIITKLKNSTLDCGLLATPLEDNTLNETPLFYEPFVAFVAENHPLYIKKQLYPSEVEKQDLILLGETHCLRQQVMNLCSQHLSKQLRYEAASIETLRKMTLLSNGITLLPELATYDLPENELDAVRYFEAPEPVREISLVTHRSFVKRNLLKTLEKNIIENVPQKMLQKESKKVVGIRGK